MKLMLKYRTFAVVGKGGSGKSTFAVLFAQQLIKRGIHPLLIDADPTMSHLAKILGVEPTTTIEKIRQELIDVAAHGNKDQKTKMATSIDDVVEKSIIKQDNYSLLVMGQPVDSGCFCPSNTLLRDVIENITNKYNLIIIDCEAGVEQIHRNVIKSIDYLIILSDSSQRSLETADAIRNSAQRFMDLKEYGVVINKIKESQKGQIQAVVGKYNFPLLGMIPNDGEIENYDFQGIPLMKLPDKSKSIAIIKNIIDKMDLGI
jgi:CO dehydrogenase maturation factor